MNLVGRVALVTGAARRVGRAIALELADAGCDVAVHYSTSADEAVRVVEEVCRRKRRCIAVAWDFDRAPDAKGLVGSVVENLGGLDILVNNAAVFELPPGDSIESFDSDAWQRFLRINTVAPASLCSAAAPVMRHRGGGKIVNLCDIGAERPWVNHLAYCASKAALVSLTRGLARALAPEVQVNGVSPGIAVFPESYDSATRAGMTAKVPMQRTGSPEEIARTVRFLVEGPDYITGQIIAVDGGRSLV